MPADENNDDNSWRLRVNFDIDGNGAYDPLVDRDDADGVATTGDEIIPAYDRMSLQHGANATSSLYFFVDATFIGQTVSLNNFDLDNSGTLVYFPADGSVVPGTPSGGTGWAGGNAAASPPHTGWRPGDGHCRHGRLVALGSHVGPGEPVYPGEHLRDSHGAARPPNPIVPETPELSISKDDGLSEVEVGSTLTYTITVDNVSDANPNPGPATDVTVTDTLPPGLTFQSCVEAPGGSCAQASGVVTFSVPDIAAGDTATMTVTALVTAATPAGDIDNTATVTYDDTRGRPLAPESANDVTALLPPIDLTITKTDGDATGTPSGVVAYTLTYDQVGTEDLTGVVITETVPVDSTFAAAASDLGWICTPDGTAGSTCTLTVGALAATDGPATTTFAVTVDDPYPADAPDLSNTVSIADDGSFGPDADPVDNTASDVTPVDAGPDLVVVKTDTTATEPAPAGATIGYSIDITNTGNAPSTLTTITDTPAGPVTIASVSVSQGTVTTAGPATAAADIGTIAVGQTVTLTYEAVVDTPLPAGQTSVVNQATVTNAEGQSVVSDDPSEPGASDPNLVDLDAVSLLDVAKVSDAVGPVTPGDVIGYTITATNTGSTPLTDVTADDPAPTGTTIVAGTATVTGTIASDDMSSNDYSGGQGWTGDWVEVNDGAGNPDYDTDGGACDIGDVCTYAEGGSTRIRVENNDNGIYRQVDLTTATTASLTYDVRIENFGAGGNPDWIAVYASTTPPTASARGTELIRYTGPRDDAAFSTEAPLDLAAFVGAPVYLSFITNPSNMGNANAGLFDDIRVDGTRTSTEPPTLTATPVLGPGESSTWTFDVAVDAPLAPSIASIDNQATVDTAETTPQIASTSDPVIDPTITVTKDDGVALTDDVAPGDVVTYTIDVENTSAIAATGVELADTPDPDTALVVGSVASTQGTVTTGNTLGDTSVAVDVGVLAPGATATITFDVAVDSPFPGGDLDIANQAIVAVDGIADVVSDDPETAAADDATVTNVGRRPRARTLEVRRPLGRGGPR